MSFKVETKNGLPTLFVNGKETEPIFFFTNTEMGKDDICAKVISLAGQHGIHLYSVCVSLPLHLPEDQINYEQALRPLKIAVAADPLARILLRVNISVYGENTAVWEKEHPGDMMRFDFDVERIDDATNYNYAGTAVSMASEAWLEKSKKALLGLHEAVSAHPELDRALLGYHVAAGETGEWFHTSVRERGVDISETNRKSFIRYLQKKYTSIENLRQAWELSDKDLPGFEAVKIPSDIEGNNRALPAQRTLLTRPSDARFRDYALYASDMVADRIIQLASWIKKITSGEKLAVFFYGYHFELYDAKTGHFQLDKVLRCRDIDGFTSPVSYFERNEGGYGALMAPVDTITDAGKLWIVENDLRTMLCVRDEGGYDWVPQIRSLENLYEVYRREFAQMCYHGLGCWYMDLFARGWHYHPDIWEEIARLKESYMDLTRANAPARPDVAVLVDEEAMAFCGHPEVAGMNLLYKQRLEFYRAGLYFGFYTASDYEKRDLKAKLVVYLNPFNFTLERAQNIISRFEEDGSSVLFMHGFGLADSELIGTLTDMSVEIHDKGMLDLTSLSCPEFLGEAIPVTPGEIADGGRIKTEQRANPVTCVKEDDGASVRVLARFSQGSLAGKVSLVMKERGGIKIFFASPLCINAASLQKIGALAGAHVYMEGQDHICLTGRSSFTVHTRQAGTIKIKFPQKRDWKEVYRAWVFRDTDSAEIEVEAFSTYTFL